MTAPTTATGSASWAGYGVVVTGGAAGIGLALGRAAAARGAAVMLMDIELDIAEEQAAKLRAEGAQAHALEGVDTNAGIVVTRAVSKACADVRERQVEAAFERLATHDAVSGAT